jgi:hypothetical protein
VTPRRQLGAGAVLAAGATGLAAIAVVEARLAAGTAALAVAFVLATVVAAWRTTAVAGPVLFGAGLAWPVATGGHGAAWAVPIVAGVVLVAELLGAAGELGPRVGVSAEPGYRRAGAAAVLTAVIAAGVALLTGLPGPGS